MFSFAPSMDKREYIIHSAMALFAEKGFDNTSIREISNKAGVNVAMVSYYFGSKEKLFEAMIEQKSNFLKTKLEQLCKDETMSEMQKINKLISDYVTRILENPAYHRILHQQMLLNARPELNTMIKSLFCENTRYIRKIFEAGIAKGEFREVDIELTIISMFGTISQFLQRAYLFTDNQEEFNNSQYPEEIRIRLESHLQQMMQAHLLKN
ncbi:MAG: TetR family transcriptional regulator [Chitinophagaceae bacterium]